MMRCEMKNMDGGRLTGLVSLMLVVTFLMFAAAPETVMAGTASGSTTRTETGIPEDAACQNGEIIVTFNTTVSDQRAENVARSEGGTLEETIDLGTGAQARTTAFIQTEDDVPIQQTLRDYEEKYGVASVQPNYKYTIREGSGTTDTRASGLWHFDTMQIEKAWKLVQNKRTATGHRSKVRVAVLDTGVDTSHEDLQQNLDQERCVSVVASGSTADGAYPKLTSDPEGHGTHVAGLIGADANNGKGVAGAASGSQNDLLDLFVVKVMDDNGEGDDWDIVRGIQYALSQGASVINMSFGGPMPAGYDDTLLKTAVNSAVRQGATVVCAAGNSASAQKEVPASYSSTISVANSDRWWFLNETSTFGSTLDVTAPGTEVISTYPSNRYVKDTGSSMSAPLTASVAALLYAADPNVTPARVRTILHETATDLYTKGKDSWSGYGCVNAYRAVKDLIDGTKSQTRHLSTSFKLSGRTYQSVALKWNKASGTASYTLEQKSNGFYFRRWKGTGTRVKVKKLTCGKNYGFRVVANRSSTGKLTGSVIGFATVRPAPSRVKKVKTKKEKGSIRVSFQKVSGASGYRIYRATKKKGSYRSVKTLRKGKTTGWTNQKLKKGKKYYYKVAAYRTVKGKKVFGSKSDSAGATVR